MKYVKDNLLNEFLIKLIKNGFNVYIKDNALEKGYTWAYFEKDNKIGYVQYNSSSGLSFTTVHKPNKKCGTGYRIHSEIVNPEINHAIDTLISFPRWAFSHDIKEIKKYSNFQEFIKSTPYHNDYVKLNFLTT